jgi:hypothetical protein
MRLKMPCYPENRFCQPILAAPPKQSDARPRQYLESGFTA